MSAAKLKLILLLNLCLILTAASVRAEVRQFPGYQLDLPPGWTVASEEELGEEGSYIYVVTLKSDDQATELRLQSHYKAGQAEEEARLLGRLYSGGQPGKIALGDKAYKVQPPDKELWMAFASLGSDLMLSVNCNKPENGPIKLLLRSVKLTEIPPKYLAKPKKKAERKIYDAREAGIVPPPPGLDAARQLNLMKQCLNGRPADIRAALVAGADPRRGLADLAWPAVLGRDQNGRPQWTSPLVEAGKLADLFDLRYKTPFSSTGGDGQRWQFWGPLPSTTPLMTAAYANPDPDSLKILLAAGADPNEVTVAGVNALALAAMNNPNVETLRVLIEAGADPNPAIFTAYHPLLLAAQYNPDPRAIEILLAAGADPAKAVSNSTLTGLAAAHNPNLEVLKTLLRFFPPSEEKLDANTRQPLDSPLVTLLNEPNARPEALALLLEAGADLKEKGRVLGIGVNYAGPLAAAARYGNNPDIIRMLLKAGADPNERFYDESWRSPQAQGGASPLSASVNRKVSLFAKRKEFPWNKGVTEALIEGGAKASDDDIVLAAGFNGEGESLRYIISVWRDQNPGEDIKPILAELLPPAIKNSRLDIIEVIMDEGFDLKAAAEENPDLAVDLLSARFFKEKNVRERLAVLKLDPKAVSSRGDTVLTRIVNSSKGYLNMPESVPYLIEAGADLNALNGKGESPLMLAVSRHGSCYPEIIKTLLEAGADPNLIGGDGTTALMFAAAGEVRENVDLLLTAGAEVHHRDSRGRDALMYAAMPVRESGGQLVHSESSAVIRLLAAGADPRRRDSDGFSALSYAAGANTDPAAVRVLVEAGADIEARDKMGRTILELAVDRNPNPLVAVELLNLGAGLGRGNRLRSAVVKVGGDFIRNAGAMLCGYMKAQLVWLAYGREKTKRLAGEKKEVAFGDKVYLAALMGKEPEASESVDGESLWPLLREKRADKLAWSADVAAAIGAGADLEKRDELGRTPLIYASQNFQGQAALLTVKRLLEAGADPGAVDVYGLTPLMYAARFQNQDYLYGEIISLLIKHGADLEARDPLGFTAFMQTAAFEPSAKAGLEKLKILQKLGAEVKVRDHRGATAIVNTLLLMDNYDFYQITDWLMAQGVDPGLSDEDGINAALASALARRGGHISSFYKAGSDPLATDKKSRNALMHLMRQFHTNDQWVLDTVSGEKTKPDWNFRDEDGLTVLGHALFSQASPNTLKLLIQNGAGF